MGSEQYVPYLRAHDLTSYLLSYQDICGMVEKLIDEKCIDKNELDELISKEIDLEVRTILMELKNKMFSLSSTYSFEDF